MIFRFARHTDNLDLLTEFYCNILNLEIIGGFNNHDKYDGKILGKKDLDWQLEFTTSIDKVQHQFDEDDILVFYPRTVEEYKEIIGRVVKSDLKLIESKNPYWNKNGIMIKDPDGYGVIISDLKLNNP